MSEQQSGNGQHQQPRKEESQTHRDQQQDRGKARGGQHHGGGAVTEQQQHPKFRDVRSNQQQQQRQWKPRKQQREGTDGDGIGTSSNFERRSAGGSGRSTPANVNGQEAKPNQLEMNNNSNRRPPNNNRREHGAGNNNNYRFRQHQQHGNWKQSAGGIDRALNKKAAKQRTNHAGVQMTGPLTDCLICCQHSDLFAIGECMHPVCMECALRIRVVGESRQCPQCRAEIQTLYFICSPPAAGQQLMQQLPSQTVPFQDGQKLGVKFDSTYAIDCFTAYMANRCVECTKKNEKVDFSTFEELRFHLTQVHNLSFCHICCDNLNVLTKDRRVYTRDQLQQHMAGRLSGEEDGFRGHPTCKFCEERFYDDEQQYRHLRKDHYFCQFCDQDGLEQNVFYRNQHQLNQHNRRFHQPCSDPDCLQVGIVFRTDTELDIHRAKQHRIAQTGGGAGRSGVIPLDIQFSRSGYTRGNAPHNENFGENATEVQRPVEPSVITRIVPSAQHHSLPTRIIRSGFHPNPVQSSNDFPSLQTSIPPPTLPYGAPLGWTPPASQNTRSLNTSRQQLSGDQFPTLGGVSGPSSSSVGGQTKNSIWAQKSTKDLFKHNAQQSTTKKEAEETKRSKFIPAPDCWPEGMREQLKAREMGMPDPDPVVPPSWLNPPKKEKKKKSKTVPVFQVIADKIKAESAKMATTSSKFSTLAELSDSIERGGEKEAAKKARKTGKAKGANWWDEGEDCSSQPMMKLTPSDSGEPGFMRIELRRETGRKEGSDSEDESKETDGDVEKGQNRENAENEAMAGTAVDALPFFNTPIEPPPGFPPPGFTPLFQSTTADEVKSGIGDDPGGGAEAQSTERHQPLTMQSIASVLFGNSLFGGGGEEKAEKK